MPATTTGEDAQLRERIESLARAIRAKDVNAVMAHYSPDIVTFDVLPPLQVQGDDAYRDNFEKWFASLEGPIDYEMSELRVTSSGDVAFCHSLSHVKGIWKRGEKADYWVRVTTCFRKIDGRWLVVHEHVSKPAKT